MYKLIISSLILLTLTSCTMPWDKKDTSFVGLYRSHIRSLVESNILDRSLPDVAQSGTMGAHVSVPPLLSGSLQTAWSMMSDKDRN
jgi:hypothetical protein